MRVMSAGRGFQYLLKSVAAGDGDRDLGTPLTRYYAHEDSTPGRLVRVRRSGLGSDGAGRISAGDEVTEEHLARLLGKWCRSGHRGAPGPCLWPLPDAKPAGRRRTGHVAGGGARRGGRDAPGRGAAAEELSAGGGFDFHFSVSKSVSTLWAVTDAGTQAVIVRAHHAAMQNMLGFMEHEVAATRVGKGGVAHLGVRGLIATGYDQCDSCAGHPQLLTHLVVANKVQSADGKWRTLDSKALHRATVALLETYTAYPSHHSARLHGVSWEPVDRGTDRNPGWEIAGIPTLLLDKFSRRSRGSRDDGEAARVLMRRSPGWWRERYGRSPSARMVIRPRQQATLETRPEKTFRSLAAVRPGLAQLVVHFMVDPVAGLRKMARVTRTRGVVAACAGITAADEDLSVCSGRRRASSIRTSRTSRSSRAPAGASSGSCSLRRA